AQVENWPYPPMNLDLRSIVPWRVHQTVFCDADCKFWNLRPPVGEGSTFTIYYFAELPAETDPLESKEFRTGVNVMTDLLIPFKVLEQTREDAEWQGRRSVTFTSRLLCNDEPLYSVSRLVLDPRSTALL